MPYWEDLVLKKYKYEIGDLISVISEGFTDIATVLNISVTDYDKLYEFYEVGSALSGEIYIIPQGMIEGEITGN